MNEILEAASTLATALGAISLGSWAYVYAHLGTGISTLERIGIRGGIAYSSLRVFGPKAMLHHAEIPRALMAIVHQERSEAPGAIGDANLPGGPSIGPGQVYRATAIDLGLWSPPMGAADGGRAAYAQLAADEPLMLIWSAKVFRSKLKQTGSVPEAIRAYNGSGLMARSYRDQALEWASSLGWELT